jgi:hypothetical protein
MNRLDDYLGAVIDIDSKRYRIVGLDRSYALLAEPDPAGGIADDSGLVRLHVDDVAEGMVLVVGRREHGRAARHPDPAGRPPWMCC